MPYRRALGWAVALLLGTALGGCGRGHTVGEEPMDGGPPDGGGTFSDPGAPPPPPAGEDTGSGARQVFALTDVVLELSESEALRTGYDLDGLDTTASGPAECSPPALGADLPVDGEHGIDNVFTAHVYRNVDTTLQLSSLPAIRDGYPTEPEGCDPDLDDPCERLTFQEVARRHMDAGDGTLLLVLDGYDGEPNDPRVAVTLLQAAAGAEAACAVQSWDPDTGELVLEGGDPAPAPGWVGGDCFWPRLDGYVAGDPANGAMISNNAAYVTDGTLVMELPDGRGIDFRAGPVGARMILSGGWLTADLEAGSIGGVVVAGRWALTDLITTSPRLGICEGTVVQSTFASVLRSEADLRRAPPDDPGLDLDCDAMSLGLRFDRAEPVTLGEPLEGPPLPNPCP